MAEKKRKVREESQKKTGRGEKKRKQLLSRILTTENHKKKKNIIKKKSNHKGDRRKTGPRLPNALRKAIDLLNPKPRESDEEIDSDAEVQVKDVYEYEERMPEEESKKNRRFDHVDNLEYELPEEFEDEDLSSEDDDDDDNVKRNDRGDGSNQVEDEEEKENDDRHSRMVQAIIGMQGKAVEELEADPSRAVFDGDGHISIQDLLEPLHGKPGYSKLRKRVQQLEKKSMPLQAPLPKVDREKLDRKAAYEQSKKEITKWEPLVKRNREAPTIYFDEDVNLGFSTVGAIASEFEPRTDFEKKIASVMRDAQVVEAHNQDGSRLLELNKISIEDVKDRQNRLAKMRSLLFRHEMKAKHIKKIKSKTYHRLLKKDKMKAASTERQMDPEAAKEYAMKQEFKRAEERMRLKHKNSSKWAKRILKRGLNAQDEGTRAAISEQLHQHTLLTRKMNSMKDSSSSDEDEDDDEDDMPGTEQDEASKLLTKAKEKTLKVIEEEDEMPQSGVLSLPFMVRGLKKRKEAAYEEAKLVLQEYDSSLKQLEDTDELSSPKVDTSCGRRVFGMAKKNSQESTNKKKSDNIVNNSDSEDDLEPKENVDVEHDKVRALHNDAHIDCDVLRQESGLDPDNVFKSFDDIVRDPGPKTTYEVSIFAPDSSKKMKREKEVNGNGRKPPSAVAPSLRFQNVEEVDRDTDTESGEEMVDGILSSATKPSYELPSQADLIHRAFAGDDVEEEFEKDKLEILNEEVPEPEKPVLLPGWGQWTHIQQKKGLPSWMLEEHENAKKKRGDALKRRKDAHLKHVIISEKIDKKAAKLHTKTLPYPYTSKEVFEQSIRMPIGPEFNPATSVGALNRPEVVKKSGIIIKPIKFEEVNPYDKVEEQKHSGRKQRTKNKGSGGKTINKKIEKKVN
ncbi:PREDICTED: uncharacterized protein C57A7.06 [Nelumbo nucifera]|uniref:Uncharacterized protein C57A7.06 n=2 Tax=Nelumbo nucifera TaxID=4432 RepID=A0A1U7ZYA5_NELNU|nr:PREDICTED: uncharacterized protein C57A7.06 [Nelumbo nucifera]DAD38099.1 TPA_asm: hypothetical protein HUJ06_008740 [Nelumbo nucifera]